MKKDTYTLKSEFRSDVVEYTIPKRHAPSSPCIIGTTVANRILNYTLDGDSLSPETYRNSIDAYLFIERCARVVTAGQGDHEIGVRYDTLFKFRDGSEIIECGGGYDTPDGWSSAK